MIIIDSNKSEQEIKEELEKRVSENKMFKTYNTVEELLSLIKNNRLSSSYAFPLDAEKELSKLNSDTKCCIYWNEQDYYYYASYNYVAIEILKDDKEYTEYKEMTEKENKKKYLTDNINSNRLRVTRLERELGVLKAKILSDESQLNNL